MCVYVCVCVCVCVCVYVWAGGKVNDSQGISLKSVTQFTSSLLRCEGHAILPANISYVHRTETFPPSLALGASQPKGLSAGNSMKSV